jgi:dolichol-phosphate mannosyltransferase
MRPDTPDVSSPGRFQWLAAGLLAIGLDSAVFHYLNAGADALATAHIAGFFAGTAAGGLLLGVTDRGVRTLSPARWLAIAVIALLALFLRGGLLASLVQILAVPATIAHFIAAIFSLLAFYGGYLWFADPRRAHSECAESRWDRFCLGVVLYAVLLRLLYLGVPELLFEEAYYWNYAKHLDIGYLDHPLMVAWIIRPFVALMGNIEFAVRAGAFLCWLVTAWFSYRLTRDVLGRAAAYRALTLVAVLPVFFFFGVFMSPDAPLTACWSAAIYFTYRVVIKEEPRAWLGLGVALGLGMISKYTVVLLGAAIVVFVLIDRPSRRWLARPQPYIAALIALVLFSPVIVWNWQQDWASFAFQSQDRLASKFSFSLPRFAGNVIALLTPTGILSVIALVVCRRQLTSGFAAPVVSAGATSARSYFLLTWLALFPVAAYAAISLFRESKLNWTGPCWLGLVPLMALLVTPAPALESGATRLLTWCRRAWPPTMVVCLLLYGALLHWLGPGLPGVSYPQNMHLIGWRNFARDFDVVVQEVTRETGQDILVVGMDRNRIASGLAFYRTQYIDAAGSGAGRDPAFHTASENLFGSVGLMYALWFPASQQNGKTMLLVGKDVSILSSPKVLSRVKTAGDIRQIEVWKQGKPAGRYYYRLVTGYQAAAASVPAGDAGRDN